MPKPALRRGFKTEAEEYAKEFRAELGLEEDAPLCPRRLAEHLSIPVYPLSFHRSVIPEAVHCLHGMERCAFSAATVFKGSRRAIVYNDANSLSRQANDIAHELAHGILGHRPGPPLSDEGCRNFDPYLENEANFLGPTLLVPRPAALRIAWRGMSLTQAAVEYGVSESVIRMRLNLTGALLIVDRTRTRRANLGPYIHR
jgi:Zn-dependent peptidase ImmA (M78 family)